MKNILITGGSRGIGAACVKEFSKNGFRVFLNYNNSEKSAKKLADETGAIPIKADISNSDEVKKMIDFTAKFVNCAQRHLTNINDFKAEALGSGLN